MSAITRDSAGGMSARSGMLSAMSQRTTNAKSTTSHTHGLANKAATEQAKVEELKQILEEEKLYNDQHHDLFVLRRFLAARNFDVDAAHKMWEDTCRWRREFGADAMLDKDVLEPERKKRLLGLFPHGLHGVDKEGRPVLVYQLGETKLSAVLSEFDELTLQRVHVQLFEFIMRVAMPAASLAAGHHIDKICTIFDIKGLSMWDMTKIKALLIPTMAITRDNYPETLGQVIIINAPMIFDGAYQVGKRMLTVETQRKIQVTGSRYKDLLFKHVEPSQVPAALGGSSHAPLSDNWGPWQTLIQQTVAQTAGDGAAATR
mmetsp:Transcript_39293/g.116925  ORF Transcript_39293/g.116925 Transcript_39293/m.116925 type:complete len:317 (-) Transcript_39293:625-1575(-)